ncbi:MAG: transglutaminase protein [Gammaproteobacteria bacterium]|nr:transglutaminase protein [Gammaproteobacteria bacterium]
MNKTISRRALLQGGSATLALSGTLAALPRLLLADDTATRTFDPKPGTWRNFEVVTTVQLRDPSADATVWVPVPTINTHWQRSLSSETSGNAEQTSIETDPKSGARFVVAQFKADTPSPSLQVTSRVQTMDRAVDWKSLQDNRESTATLRRWVQPSALVPTDGIVRKTALQITKGAHTDVDKVHRIYDWTIVSTYREPKVRGCGVGDIKALLETGDLGGKCADINGLFVGLCRAAGIPARDAYGLRLAPSAFGYKELGGNPASLKGAQHCRSEVHLQKYGWVAMDPADVDKVMRQETSEWIKDAGHPLVVPVRKALFGGWEGNWMAYNTAVDVTLPGAAGASLPFLMYPQAQSGAKRYDSYDPDNFKYTITSREIKAL